MHPGASPNWRRHGDFRDGGNNGRLMVLARVVFFLLLLSGIVCFGAYVWTSQRVWRQRGISIVKWTLLAAGLFFAGLIAQKLVEML